MIKDMKICTCPSDLSISIGIPVYNEEENIQNLLCSLALQRGVNISETIIVNDGSNDKTVEKIMETNDEVKHILNLKVISLSENKGLSYALNLIFEEASSEYLIILPSDAILLEQNTLSKIVKQLSDNDNVGLVCGWYKVEIYSSFDVVGRAYRFSSRLLERIAKTKDIYGTGAVWLLPKKVYKNLQLPTDICRVDAYIYLFSVSLNRKFIFVPEAKVVIKLPKENLKRFLYRQTRSRSIPEKHIEVFGDLAKREFKEPNLKFLLKIFVRCFIKHPFDGIFWCILKMISYAYRKMLKPQPTVKWRAYETTNIN